MELSIIIVTHNSANVIEECLVSILNNLVNIVYEIIVVDNNSTDKTLEILSNFEYNRFTIVKNKQNVGFAKANNLGFRKATGEFILILNPDVIFDKKTDIKILINELDKNENVAIVAPKLIYENGLLQESARSFPNPLVLFIRGFNLGKFFNRYEFYKNYFLSDSNDNYPREVDWVIGAFILIKKNLLIKVNYFDEKFFMYYEDADLCLRLLRNGYKTLYFPAITVTHKYKRESAKKLFSVLKMYHIKSILRFYIKHFSYLFFGKTRSKYFMP
jgi:GT2 family glycosyltransferase